MRTSFVLTGLMMLAASASLFANQILFPGQSALVGNTVVECRSGGSTGGTSSSACSDNGLIAARAFCNEFNTWAGTDNCLAALRDASFFDKKIIVLCRAYNTWDGALDCVRASVNRYYDASEVQACNSRPTWPAATACLGATGTRVWCAR